MSPLQIYPDGEPFPPLPGPIITREQLRLEEIEHPERFGPEYGAQWGEVIDAYLDPKHVARVFEPWRNETLTMQSTGRPDIDYYAHADPGRSGANFALVIAHAESEGPDLHVVVDLARVWEPRRFTDGIINYVQVENEIFDLIRAFHLRHLTFDQWNSASAIDHLRARVREASWWWRTDVSERTATSRSNWAEAENFKTALLKNVVHSPYLELAERELLSLQWDGGQKVHPPATGPCTTSDTADCYFAVTHALLEGRFDPFKALSEHSLRAGYPGGLPVSGEAQQVFDQLSGFGGNQTMHGAARQRPPRNPRRQPRYGPHRRPGRGYGFQ